MGVTERKEREKEEMRSRILEAARTLFIEQGFDKTSIRNIAEAIEYSPGTIYLYFKDKNELLHALHTQAFEGFSAALAKAFEAPTAPLQLKEMGHQYIQYAIQNPEMYELIFTMRGPLEVVMCREEAWVEGKTSFDFLRQVVRGCQEAGMLRQHDVESASMMIWSFVHGLVMLHNRQRLSFFEETPEETLQRMYLALDTFYQQMTISV